MLVEAIRVEISSIIRLWPNKTTPVTHFSLTQKASLDQLYAFKRSLAVTKADQQPETPLPSLRLNSVEIYGLLILLNHIQQ